MTNLKINCLECNKEFTKYRPQNNFCSSLCRGRFFAKRRKALVAEALEARAQGASHAQQ
jgi:hypothetical protein